MHRSTFAFSMLVAVATLMIAGSANAELLIYEPFNYSTGATGLTTTTTYGDGLTGPWTGNQTNNWFDNGGTGLTYGSLQTEGAAARTNGGWRSANSPIDTATLGASYSNLLADGGDLWFSLLLFDGKDPLTSGGPGRFAFSLSTLGINPGDGRLIDQSGLPGEAGVGIGFFAPGNGTISANVWADDDPSGTQTNPNNLSNVSSSNNDLVWSNVTFVVGHVEWGDTATDADRVTLYLPGTDLALGSAVSVSEGVIADQSGIDVLGFHNLRDFGIVDEIRVGATYADVSPSPIPESGSLALLVLGGLCLLGFRRRR